METYHMIIVKGQTSQDAITELQPTLNVVFSAGVTGSDDMTAVDQMADNMKAWLAQHA